MFKDRYPDLDCVTTEDDYRQDSFVPNGGEMVVVTPLRDVVRDKHGTPIKGMSYFKLQI
jgi:hypothetical protein